MSEQLTISSAISVFLMLFYVLFGGQAQQVELGPQGKLLPSIESPAILPQASLLLAR
jgi:hypothetical protein